METGLELQGFYPIELEITNIYQIHNKIRFKMFARSKSCACPKCGKVSGHLHGTYERKVQDISIIGKTT